MLKRIHTLILLTLLTLSGALFAQNHPELEWKTLESEHFIYHYHSGTEWSVQQAMLVAESVYPHVTGLYGWEPKEKTQIVIQDTDDYANGGAYYFDNKILIWASPLEFELRGNHQWMWNVLTHEFSHIVSLGASMKLPMSIPMLYVQYLDREKPIKENIILEYPKGIGSLPIANSIIPMWWAEGVAQYQYEKAGHDTWDSQRDMILRENILNDRILSWSDIGHFGHTGIGNEVVYNTGYAFARYLAELYGPSIHDKIAQAASNKINITFNKVLKEVTGIQGKELYADFIVHLKADYLNKTATIKDNLVEGVTLYDKGPGNFLASYSPNGERMVFQSSQGFDYLSFNFLYTMENEKTKLISKNRVRGNVAWSPDGDTVFFAQRQKSDIYGSTWFDLMAYDFENKKLKKLTNDARVYSVASDTKGNLYIIRVDDGTHNIYKYNAVDSLMSNLTNFSHGEQIFIMQTDKEGKHIYFDMAFNHGRDIYQLDLSNAKISPFVYDVMHDNRSPYLSPDGNTLYYSSDKTGIFNIYSVSINDNTDIQLHTNITGAAMYPAIDPKDGSLTYTQFKAGKFALNKIDTITNISREASIYKDYILPSFMQESATEKDLSEAIPYTNQFSKLFFVPFLQYDYDALKGGIILFQNEILNKLSLFALGDINYRGDYDLQAHLEFNQFLPTIYLDVMAVGLNRNDTVLYNDYEEMKQDIKFSLSEVQIGINYTWRNRHYFEITGTHGQYTSRVNGTLTSTNELIKFAPGTYYTGQRLEFRYHSDFTRPHWQSNISPTKGLRINNFVMAYDFNKFIDGFRVSEDYGTVLEVYNKHYTPRFDLDADYFIPIPGTKHSALSFNLNIGLMTNTKVDSFFNYFAGGLPGLKGYPYYTIEGTHKAILTSTLRFPISKRLGINFEPFSLESLYFGIYHQIGDAWTWGLSAPDWKQDIGIQARIAGHSWYGFPLALSFDLVYAMDMIQYDEFDITKTIGHNFRFYWTVLFDF